MVRRRASGSVGFPTGGANRIVFEYRRVAPEAGYGRSRRIRMRNAKIAEVTPGADRSSNGEVFTSTWMYVAQLRE